MSRGIIEKGRRGTLQGIPCPRGCPWGLGHPMTELFCLRGSAMAELHGRSPLLGSSGLRLVASVRAFRCVSFGIRSFSRTTEVGSTRFLNRCEAIFDTDATVLVS